MTNSAMSALLVAFAVPSLALGRAQAAPQKAPLPPLSYVCPMPADADVIEDKPGQCPKCGMRLTPVRLDTTWTCPIHGAVHKDAPGPCPIDGRPLIQVTMSLSWHCKGAEARAVAPGRCPDGSDMMKEYAARPHGNHNPQHGGQFFMASDNWHHLEGVYPRAGAFRIYFYDDFTKPLPRDQMRAVAAEVVVNGRAFPLTSMSSRTYLEAKIPKAALPATMQARVHFTKDDGKGNVFDFTFADYSKNPAPIAPTATGAAMSAPPITARVPTAAGAPAAAAPRPAAAAPTTEPLTLSQTIPGTVPEILIALRTRTDQIRGLIDKGLFGEVYVPAFQAKDLAVALETHQSEVSPDRRPVSEAALSTLVRDAYLLDAFGDLGNKQQISDAFTEFNAAATDVMASFPHSQP